MASTIGMILACTGAFLISCVFFYEFVVTPLVELIRDGEHKLFVLVIGILLLLIGSITMMVVSSV